MYIGFHALKVYSFTKPTFYVPDRCTVYIERCRLCAIRVMTDSNAFNRQRRYPDKQIVSREISVHFYRLYSLRLQTGIIILYIIQWI